MSADPKPGKVPAEVLGYLMQRKVRGSWSHDEVWNQEHSAAFVVAKATEESVVESIKRAVTDAIEQGTPFEEFAENIQPILEKQGWWGRQSRVNPLTGEKEDVQLGSAARLKLIYQTNIRQSRAAGQWSRIQRSKAFLPKLKYRHGHPERPRPEHLAWDGITLPVDDPWWDTHYPQNGYACQCWVEQVGARAPTTPEEGVDRELVEVENKRTGQRTMTAKGVDPSFAYNVGKVRGAPPPPTPAELPPSIKPPPPPPRPPAPVSTAKDRNHQEHYLNLRAAGVPRMSAERIGWGRAMAAKGGDLTLEEYATGTKDLATAGVTAEDHTKAFGYQRDLVKEHAPRNMREYLEVLKRDPDLSELRQNHIRELEVQLKLIAHTSTLGADKAAKPVAQLLHGIGAHFQPSEVQGMIARSADFYGAMAPELKTPLSDPDFFILADNVDRGVYKHAEKELNVGAGMVQLEGKALGTLLHELAHGVENMNPAARAAAREYLIHRTKGETTQGLRDLTGNTNYGADEVAKPDGFYSPYQGKEYDLDTEVTSMAVEHLHSTQVYSEQVHAKDPALLDWVLGQLAGAGVLRQPPK